MLRDGTDSGDLKLMNNVLKELRYSFLVFQHYRNVRKVTMFGSARVEPHDPNYELAAALRGSGWSTVIAGWWSPEQAPASWKPATGALGATSRSG